jgi:hypothetical protein
MYREADNRMMAAAHAQVDAACGIGDRRSARIDGKMMATARAKGVVTALLQALCKDDGKGDDFDGKGDDFDGTGKGECDYTGMRDVVCTGNGECDDGKGVDFDGTGGLEWPIDDIGGVATPTGKSEGKCDGDIDSNDGCGDVATPTGESEDKGEDDIDRNDGCGDVATPTVKSEGKGEDNFDGMNGCVYVDADSDDNANVAGPVRGGECDGKGEDDFDGKGGNDFGGKGGNDFGGKGGRFRVTKRMVMSAADIDVMYSRIAAERAPTPPRRPAHLPWPRTRGTNARGGRIVNKIRIAEELEQAGVVVEWDFEMRRGAAAAAKSTKYWKSSTSSKWGDGAEKYAKYTGADSKWDDDDVQYVKYTGADSKWDDYGAKYVKWTGADTKWDDDSEYAKYIGADSKWDDGSDEYAKYTGADSKWDDGAEYAKYTGADSKWHDGSKWTWYDDHSTRGSKFMTPNKLDTASSSDDGGDLGTRGDEQRDFVVPPTPPPPPRVKRW